MARSARDGAPALVLRKTLDSGATGRLTVTDALGDVRVAVLRGEIVAAEAHDDLVVISRRLGQLGGITAEQSVLFMERARLDEPVFYELLDLAPAALIDSVLNDRFQQNLARYLGAESDPKLVPEKTIFADNMQIGHDATLLLEACALRWDLAQRHPGTTLIVQGRAAPQGQHARLVWDALISGPRSIDVLTAALPVEEIAGRSLISTLLESGAVRAVEREASGDDQAHTFVDEEDDVEVEPFDPAEDDEEPAVTARAVEPAPAHVREAPAPLPSAREQDPAYTRVEEDDEPYEPEPAEFDAEDATETVSKQAIGKALKAAGIAAPAITAFAEEEATDDAASLGGAIPEDPSDADARPSEATAEGAGDLSSLQAWLSSAADVNEDELDFFSDHDYDRGQGEGAFSTDAHNLDNVNIDGKAGAPPPPEPAELEVDEAPAARFGAPMLTEQEASSKVTVANEVLASVAAAFDDAEGNGRGRSVTQLLVEGSPGRTAALLNGLQVEDDGTLPIEDLLENLWHRPQTEHRQLLNDTLKDIIERALSSAADDLPEEAFDELYESVAGYNQRLGL